LEKYQNSFLIETWTQPLPARGWDLSGRHTCSK